MEGGRRSPTSPPSSLGLPLPTPFPRLQVPSDLASNASEHGLDVFIVPRRPRPPPRCACPPTAHLSWGTFRRLPCRPSRPNIADMRSRDASSLHTRRAKSGRRLATFGRDIKHSRSLTRRPRAPFADHLAGRGRGSNPVAGRRRDRLCQSEGSRRRQAPPHRSGSSATHRRCDCARAPEGPAHSTHPEPSHSRAATK